jgi:hypothetical protein
MEPLPSVSVPW